MNNEQVRRLLEYAQILMDAQDRQTARDNIQGMKDTIAILMSEQDELHYVLVELQRIMDSEVKTEKHVKTSLMTQKNIDILKEKLRADNVSNIKICASDDVNGDGIYFVDIYSIGNIEENQKAKALIKHYFQNWYY